MLQSNQCRPAKISVVLSCDPGIPQIRFAADEIKASLGKDAAMKLGSISELKVDHPGDFVIACGAEQSQTIAIFFHCKLKVIIPIKKLRHNNAAA